MKTVCLLSVVATLAMGTHTFADSREIKPDSKGVHVTASDPVAFRGVSSGAFLIQREDTKGDLAVKVTLSGSAENGVDYQTIPETVTIPDGFYTVGVSVNPLGNAADTPDQRVTLTIATSSDYEVGHPDHASVVIKGNAFEDQAPVVSITSPADNSSVPAHSDLEITADASDPNDSVAKVSFYADDRFFGVAEKSPYTIKWINVPAGSFSLFARAQDQFGKSTLSSAVHLTVVNPPPSGDKIVITEPKAGSSFSPGANITFSAEVTGDGPVQSVSFYSGDTLLGTDDTAPYSIVWNNVKPGRYNVRAKLTETGGAVANSEAVKIVVENMLPKVSITAPAKDAVIDGPADIAISADASDADGSVTKVTFYGDGKVLGSSTASPYGVTWSKVAPGKHFIIAVATDDFGGFSSAAVVVTVGNTPPTVKLTSPASESTFTSPATIDLKADAADADGIKSVSFWLGDRRVGEVTTEPYAVTVKNIGPGTYNVRAQAVDIYGQRTISDPVKVIVKRP